MLTFPENLYNKNFQFRCNSVIIILISCFYHMYTRTIAYIYALSLYIYRLHIHTNKRVYICINVRTSQCSDENEIFRGKIIVKNIIE